MILDDWARKYLICFKLEAYITLGDMWFEYKTELKWELYENRIEIDHEIWFLPRFTKLD